MRNATRFALLLSTALLGCTKHNPESCCSTQAQCDSFGLGQITGCEGDQVCNDNGACQAPECETSAMCTSPDAPICIDKFCVAACQADGDCTGMTDKPYCDVPTGACVACLESTQCENPTPTCDAMTQACRACVVDADCDSTVCDVDHGACSAASDVLYASPDGAETGECTQVTPCSVTHAIALVTAQKNLVRMMPGSYPVKIDVTGTVAFTIVGTGATLAGGAGGAGLSLEQSANLTVRGLDINTPASEAVHCTPPSGTAVLTLRDLSIVPAAGTGTMTVANCTLALQHVDMPGPDNGAIYPNNSHLTIDRSRLAGGIILGAGTNVTISATNSLFIGGISFSGTQITALHISFSTFPNGQPCPGSTPLPGLLFDNDIFYSNNNVDAINASPSSCTFANDIAFPQQDSPSGTNVIVMDPKFANPAFDATMGDYHLLAGSPAIDAADPSATDAVDYDGTTRPQGVARDIGAYEYKF